MKSSSYSYIGHHRSQTGSLHLSIRRPVPLRSWHRVSSDHRDLRPLARPWLGSLHDHARKKSLADRIRSPGSCGRHIREHGRHNKFQVRPSIDVNSRRIEGRQTDGDERKAEGLNEKKNQFGHACSSIEDEASSQFYSLMSGAFLGSQVPPKRLEVFLLVKNRESAFWKCFLLVHVDRV